MSTGPFCRDCRHFVPDSDFQSLIPWRRHPLSIRWGTCERLTGEVHLVTGEPVRVHQFASIQRLDRSYVDDGETFCGPEGRFFEPKA